LGDGNAQAVVDTFEKIREMYTSRDDLIKNHLQKIGDYVEM